MGYVDNGDYQITLVVPDNLDKTRAWFRKTIDISNLEVGTYAIQIKTKSTVEDCGELNDIFNRNLVRKDIFKVLIIFSSLSPTILSVIVSLNTKNYSFLFLKYHNLIE